MKPLPGIVLRLLDTLPDAQAQKIVLNTDGNGHWEIEVFSRYRLDEVPDHPPALPLREKPAKQSRPSKKRY